MSYTPGDFQNRSVVKNVVNSTFRPELFAVATGSYNSDVVYGAGSDALVPTYDSVTIKNRDSILFTTTKLRKSDKSFDFDLQIALDTTLEDPWVDQEVNGELRIRVLQPLAAGQPGAYLNTLPIALQGMPLFENVEILNENGQNALPTQPNNSLQARLLPGSTLALLRYDHTAAPIVAAIPLLSSDLSSLPWETPLSSIRIIVRGNYLIKSNPTGH